MIMKKRDVPVLKNYYKNYQSSRILGRMKIYIKINNRGHFQQDDLKYQVSKLFTPSDIREVGYVGYRKNVNVYEKHKLYTFPRAGLSQGM